MKEKEAGTGNGGRGGFWVNFYGHEKERRRTEKIMTVYSQRFMFFPYLVTSDYDILYHNRVVCGQCLNDAR